MRGHVIWYEGWCGMIGREGSYHMRIHFIWDDMSCHSVKLPFWQNLDYLDLEFVPWYRWTDCMALLVLENVRCCYSLFVVIIIIIIVIIFVELLLPSSERVSIQETPSLPHSNLFWWPPHFYLIFCLSSYLLFLFYSFIFLWPPWILREEDCRFSWFHQSPVLSPSCHSLFFFLVDYFCYFYLNKWKIIIKEEN